MYQTNGQLSKIQHFKWCSIHKLNILCTLYKIRTFKHIHSYKLSQILSNCTRLLGFFLFATDHPSTVKDSAIIGKDLFLLLLFTFIVEDLADALYKIILFYNSNRFPLLPQIVMNC